MLRLGNKHFLFVCSSDKYTHDYTIKDDTHAFELFFFCLRPIDHHVNGSGVLIVTIRMWFSSHLNGKNIYINEFLSIFHIHS